MIDEASQDLAALHALDVLEGEELRAFEARLAIEPDLRALVDELQHSAASLVHLSPEHSLSAALESRVRRAVLQEPHQRPLTVVDTNWVPWAIAASLLAACVLLALDRSRFKSRVAELEKRNFFAETQIAMLSSKLDSAPKATAVIVWDAEKQEGVLRVNDVPETARDRDYQLWVVDPQYKQPVDAGVFRVDPSGTTRITFKPKSKVQSAQAFAVSLERKGGVPKAEGPMVLAGK